MKTIMTRLFTVIMLMMFSMGAEADVKVLFGENGDDVFSGKGGTIEVKQEPDEKDETKVIVTLTVTPKKKYSISKDDIKVYATLPTSARGTRGIEISSELKLEGDDPKDLSEKREYTVTLDSNLGLWVRTAVFTNVRKEGDEEEVWGTFFIANGNGYSSTNTANNFYLVPATNSNYATDQPHLTTTKSGQVMNCCWQIIKVTVDENEYYRFKHVSDGKYLTANDAYPGAGTSDNGVRRLRVHLEEMDTPDDNTLFIITLNSKGGYNIKHKDITDDIYLDPAGGNISGTNITNARSMSTSNGKVNVGGGIGYWTDEAAARWFFEGVPQNNTYTYNIVDRQGNIAIKYTTGADQPAASALGSYTDIPAAICSPYINGETVKFYTFSGAYDAEKLTDENKITATPVANNANIYVTYTTDRLSEKFLQLRGARAFNIDDDGCIYDNGGTLGTGGGTPTVTTTTHLWYISGNDPYAVQIKNLSTGNYLVSSALPTLSLAAAATNNFILMEESAAANADHESVSLMVATGAGTPDYTTKTVSAYPVGSSVTYHLIDKAGKLIVSVPSTSSELALPDEWVSPLVSEYQYYKDATLIGDAVGSSCDFTGATTITSPFDVGSGGNIYVTYTVSDAIDITGGKTYMLKFSGGESFHQEDGHDGINKEGYTSYGVTEATKAVYPYNNGDFNLYVYGQEQWESQLSSGASTRTRWLWYIKSQHEGTDLTGDNVDPYHVVIKSYQNHKVKDTDVNYGTDGSCSSYLQTYKPSDYSEVITNIAYENIEYHTAYPAKMSASMVNGDPTEYMILGTSLLSMTLKTFNEVEGERRVVNSFEQYWKNNPTVKSLVEDSPSAPSADDPTLTAMGWHRFTSWAYSAPWGGGAKRLAEETHWYQTISMGSGQFTLEEVSLAPQVILLDQHGWEVMRVPLSDTETLRKYDSPMVETYYWNPTALKTTGYHKYHDLDPNIKIYKQNGTKWEWKDEEGYETYTFTSSTLAANPYVDHPEQPASVKTDFYVTYTVKPLYANAYHGAATEDAVTATPYLLKQGGNYATCSGSGTTIGTVATKPSRENLSNNIEWYLKPNFNIDREMGYKYAGETGAQDGAQSQTATEAANYDGGLNGFDPYNVQIQNRAYPLRYFTANTTGAALSAGVWTGTSSAVAMQNISTKQTATGYDQTTLNITNATFIVVADDNGNMRLMPRFDQSKVMQSFGTLTTQAAAASAGDEGTGTQTLFLESVAEAQVVYNSDEITDPNGYYLLAESFEFVNDHLPLGAEGSPFTGSFTGIIDGQLYTISSTLTKPLVNTANGATIKNVILENVNIDQAGNVGAIANEATGATRIYNCGILGGSVKGTAYTGGLVGLLNYSGTDGARVINCYSYANITGGSVRAGIVGYNNYASKSDDIRTMVMNCMFYGDISGGTSISPIYGGAKITNVGSLKGLNNYNYFSYEDFTASISTYNCALGVEKPSYLQRFEFYRNILNSNCELACWYATGSTANARQEMAKWVLETADRNNSNPYPYPILKVRAKYPSIVNIDAEHATTEVERNKGGKLGTLTVYIQDGSGGAVFTAPSGAGVHTGELTLNITDKDDERYNYNYRKVQLPYYNDVGNGNYTGNRVVTGWKIISVSGNSTNTFAKNTTYAEGTTNQNILTIDDCYNFADRTDTGKDLYGTSGRVFAQGAYYDVPDNVISITIQPYWAKCTYLSDSYYDVTYNTNNNNATNVTAMGVRYSNDVAVDINGSSQKVYTSMSNALSNLGRDASHSVYDYAVVFVGNYHHYSGNSSYVGNNYNNNNTNPGLPVTLMSADLDGDNEPDNVFFLQHGKTRIGLCPIRYDFLCIPDIGMAQKADGLTRMPSIGTFWPYGWFETTNTSLMHITQMEYATTKKVVSPLILQGGLFESVFTSFQGNEAGNGYNRTNYIHIGGNAYFEEFSNGSHLNNKQFTAHVPISVTGGECKSFYLSGMMLPTSGNPTEKADNAEGYIDGGKFGEVASGGMRKIDGNVTWIIYNADIKNFYGGGINANKTITGDISTTMRDCYVTTYCGGPKFGNMSSNKTVTSTINGCTIGTFFGAGFGGTSLTKQSTQQNNSFSDPNQWTTWANTYTRQYNSDYGIASRYEFKYFQFSGGSDATQVGQMYIYYASMSLAQTNDVTTTMSGSNVTGNFYGGGSLGKVAGNVNSTLTDCTVKGNVFGAGFSATTPTIEVMNVGVTNPAPGYDPNAGVFTDATYPGSKTYTWHQVGTVSNDNKFDEENNYIYTTENLSKSNLGSVAGNVTLTIKGDSKIGTDGDTTGKTGNVFGGGEQSYVTQSKDNNNQPIANTGNTTVNLEGNTEVLGNVYGGGDQGVVQGSATVNIRPETPTTPTPSPSRASDASVEGTGEESGEGIGK